MRLVIAVCSLLAIVRVITAIDAPKAKPRTQITKPRVVIPVWSAPAPSSPPVPDMIRVTNPSADAIENGPLTLARFFAVGEIPKFAAVAVEGIPVPTQCDVKTRWPDGSLQHAILSFRLNVPGNGAVSVAFSNQESGNNDGVVDAIAMLSSSYNLGAQMELAFGDNVRTINVRDMIANHKFRYWLQGGICTQVIVEDASETPAFDIGFNGNNSFHPMFVLSFYPGTRSVRVEFIGENTWLSRLQDLQYSLTLRAGNPLVSEPLYQKKNYKHIAKSRWRKIFWSGPEVPKLNIDHNLPYLISSRALPNYDLSKAVPSSGVDDELAVFNRSDRGDLGGNCLYTKYFPTTGGRIELGIFPRWVARYLYTFDPRLAEVSQACAAVSGYIPIHLRESTAGRTYSAAYSNADALGRPLSLDARPTFCTREPDCEDTPDNVKSVGATSLDGWAPDTAHQASFAYIPYLLNGDWYSLEELYFWSAWNLGQSDAGTCFYCRGQSAEGGKTISWGIFHPCQNLRAFGWFIRNLAHAALMAPDGSPEKAYFTDKFLNNIAAQEGRMNVTDGLVSFDSSRKPQWDFGRHVLDFDRSNPLCLWCVSPDTAGGGPGIDDKKATWNYAPWMQHIILINLGYVEDMGFPVQALRRRLYQFLLGELTDPGYNAYLVETYTMPASPSINVYFSSWAKILDAFVPENRNPSQFNESYSKDTEFGYGFIALGAASYMTDVQQNGRSGLDAWKWFKSGYPNQDGLNYNPMWAIVPRAIAVDGSLASPDSWSQRFKSPRRTDKRDPKSRR